MSQSCDIAELSTVLHTCSQARCGTLFRAYIAINMPAISRMATPVESIHSAGDCSGCATPTARTRMLHGGRDLEEQVAAVTVIRRIHRDESEAGDSDHPLMVSCQTALALR
jgi:hypothetical protein